MPASKHRRRGKTRSRWSPPPHLPHYRITAEEHAQNLHEEELIKERVRQLYGDCVGECDTDEWLEADRQLVAEGKIRPLHKLPN